MAKIELSKCPVCGKLPKLRCVYHDYKYFCGTHVSRGDWKHSIPEAAEDWNRRATGGGQVEFCRPTRYSAIMAHLDTVQKLADVLLKSCAEIPYCQNKPKCDEILDNGDCIPEEMCAQCLLSWLNSPVSEDEAETVSEAAQEAAENATNKHLDDRENKESRSIISV